MLKRASYNRNQQHNVPCTKLHHPASAVVILHRNHGSIPSNIRCHFHYKTAFGNTVISFFAVQTGANLRCSILSAMIFIVLDFQDRPKANIFLEMNYNTESNWVTDSIKGIRGVGVSLCAMCTYNKGPHPNDVVIANCPVPFAVHSQGTSIW